MRRTVATFKQRDTWMRAIAADDLPVLVKLVGTRLALHLHCATGRCDPAYATLAKECRLSERSVCRAVAALRMRGWLKIKGTKGWRYTNKFFFQLRNYPHHGSV
jgi:hypothetical protein